MRLGWFRAVHCKSLPAQAVRALLTARKLPQSKNHDVKMSLRGVLRGFGLKVGPTTPRTFANRIRQLVAGHTTVNGRRGAACGAWKSTCDLWTAKPVNDSTGCRRSSDIKPTISAVRRLSVTTFIPVVGISVVSGRNRSGDEVALTVRQPDGTLAQLPIWMTEDRAAAMIVMQIPRLSLACLRELRLELDGWQSLLRDDYRREGDEHAASTAELSPTRPLRAQRPTAAYSSFRADEAVAAGERAPGGDASHHR
jgi:hypothetical protein